jgi:predicted transcriptional regulator
MLTPLELDIMKAVWRQPHITVRDVQDAIRPSRTLAYTTVMTIMDRLYHKGFLNRQLEGRTHLYQAAIESTEVRDRALKALIDNFFDGSPHRLRDFLDGGNSDPIERASAAPLSTTPFDEALL